VRRAARHLLLPLAAVVALLGSGCNKEDYTEAGHTEGIYVTVDRMKYQVQMSRILNESDIEDQAYLRGLPAGEETADDEVWFGIFMRVENDSDEPHTTTDEFAIEDTQDNSFEPIELDPERNAFLYRVRELPPGELEPQPSSAPSDNTIQGSLVLFKVKTDALYNRPMELRISSAEGEGEALVNLDV
jgi:hypothetical protein